MRSLGQPRVLRAAGLAALATVLVCYPRLAWASHLAYPLWYLEAILFLGGIVLWAFVFAWHTQYTGRQVVTLSVASASFWMATAAGLAGALILRLAVDPVLRTRTPDDYPATLAQWLAMTLFSLGFSQLFLVFAPFAWLMRLLRREDWAAVLTVVFGVFVLALKHRASPLAMPPGLLLELLLVRIAAGCLSVYFFLRGGVGLVWWWGLLLQGRHLFGFEDVL